MIDSSIFYVPARYDQESPSVAFDGTNYLVVWVDERIYLRDIFGARVSPSGTVLDPVGIAICTADGEQMSPSVAFDGVNYVVAWKNDRGMFECDIYGARVDTSGAVLDSSGIEICGASTDRSPPCVASDGANSLVVWHDFRMSGTPDIWGSRINHDGIVIDPLGILIVADTFSNRYPSVVFDDINYLVVWEDSRGPDGDIYGVRLSQSMVRLDTSIAVCAGSGYQRLPSVTFGPADYFVAWGDNRMYGARVDTSGSVLDPSGIVICTTSSGSPSAVFDGLDYLVTWSGVYGARVTTSGIPLDPSGLRISPGNGAEPCAASDGISCLVAWEDERGGIYGSRVSQSGTVLDTLGILISATANRQLLPAAAYGSRDYFTVWGDDRNGGQFDIYGARVDPSGTVLDPSGITICGTHGNQEEPSLAFGDPNYLVVWRDGRGGSDWQVCGRRVSQSGTVLDTSIVIGTGAYFRTYPRVAFGKDNYLVVWLDDSFGVYGARVDSSGVVLDTPAIPISSSYTWRVGPAVASNGIDYFVVWAQGRSFDSLDIYGSRVTGSGTVLDTSAIAISTVIGGQTAAFVAFDGRNYLLVWEDHRFVPYSDIYGARVDTSGVVLDPYPSEILVSTADGDQRAPSVSYDGSGYFVIWEDGRSGDSWDIYGARVDTTGVVLDTLGLELIRQSPGLAYPVIWPRPEAANGPGSQFLIVYDCFLPEPYYSPRVFGALYPDIGVTEDSRRPKTPNVRLLQNHPNPFHRSTLISYSLPAATQVTLCIYDITGRLVETLVNETQQPGIHQIRWDREDNPSGVYFYRLNAEEFIETKKMVVVE